jgi:SAM-dependent methyltransferase
LPVPDGSVSEVYSAHCLEHVQNLSGVLWELARVCRHGARIEIHVPHWLNPDAMCPGHRHVITENVVKGWCREERCGKRFELASVWHLAGALFEEAKELHPTWKDEQVLKFVPGAAFETQFVLRVVQGG